MRWPVWLRWLTIGACSVCILAALGWWGLHRFRRERQLRALAELQLVHQRELLQGQAAVIAQTVAQRDSFRILTQAEHQLNGRLVAAVLLHLAQRDTALEHHATTYADTGRSLAWRDSTFAGLVTGQVYAPRDPAQPLYLSYHLTRPAFDPSVGFIQVGDSTVAVVDWRGEHVQVAVPYFKPYPHAPGLFHGLVGGFTELNWRYHDGFEVRGGALVRVGPWRAQAFLALPAAAAIGVRREF